MVVQRSTTAVKSDALERFLDSRFYAFGAILFSGVNLCAFLMGVVLFDLSFATIVNGVVGLVCGAIGWYRISKNWVMG